MIKARKVGVAVTWNQAHTHVLIDRRLPEGAFGGMWEFPGGKIEPAETPEDCIHRELAEELGIKVAIVNHLITIEYFYKNIDPKLQIMLIVYNCVHLEGTPQPLQSSEVRWVKPTELREYLFPEANYQIIQAITSQ